MGAPPVPLLSLDETAPVNTPCQQRYSLYDTDGTLMTVSGADPVGSLKLR